MNQKLAKALRRIARIRTPGLPAVGYTAITHAPTVGKPFKRHTIVVSKKSTRGVYRILKRKVERASA